MTTLYKAVFLNIITRPRKSFRIIADYNLDKFKTYLLVLIGISNVISRQFIQLADTNNNFFLKFLGLILIGGLLGWIGVYIISWLISITGKWLGGQARLYEINNMITYAALPSVLILISSLLSILFLRLIGFKSNEYSVYMHTWSNNYYSILQIKHYLWIAFNLYYLTLLIIGLSVFQIFTIWKSIANLILAISIFALPFALIIFAIYFKSHQ